MALRRPPPLRPGDRIAVVAPASAADPKSLAAGARRLASLGYDVRLVPARPTAAGFGGSDPARASALLRAVADDRVRAIVFARGGYGAARILPLVERALRRERPKILVGYSDTTALLAFASGQLGWATFHGPMISSEFPSIRRGDLRAFARALGGETIAPFTLTRTYRRGVAEGTLVGGCLSILVSLLGTPYFPKLDGRLLFLEDVNEQPYQLDRMLTHLRLAGVLARVRGIVFAVMQDCGEPRAMHAVLAERTADLGVPVAYGLPSGHGRGKRTLPFGVRARLDAGRRRLEILETPVGP